MMTLEQGSPQRYRLYSLSKGGHHLTAVKKPSNDVQETLAMIKTQPQSQPQTPVEFQRDDGRRIHETSSLRSSQTGPS